MFKNKNNNLRIEQKTNEKMLLCKFDNGCNVF